MPAPGPETHLTRRRALAGLAVGAAGTTSGCLGRFRTIVGWPSGGAIALDIKTVPADDDPYAPRIARRVAEWFRAAGLKVQVTLLPDEELRRQVLLNHEFDVFVARTPEPIRDPDALYPMLHSTADARLGWQNPFGYTDPRVDEYLARQRRTTGSRRRAVVADLQHVVAKSAPFGVVAFANTIYTAREDRFTGWDRTDLTSPLGYLALDGADGDEGQPLRLVTTDPRVTENMNPLTVEFRDRTRLTDLLYDPLGRVIEGKRRPWVAADWSFARAEDGLRATVRLRPDVQWHDGEALTVADVAFTYEFLADTTAGASEEAIPAPRYRGEVELVDAVEAVEERTATFTFGDVTPEVARRAFSVPILPAHVWTDRTDQAGFGGLTVETGVTEALVTENVPPVGSGPLAFVEHTPSESLVLERFGDHFLHGGTGSQQDYLPQGLPFERLELRSVRSDSVAVELVADGTADATASGVGAGTAPRIGRDPDLSLQVRQPGTFYLVGFNARREPLSNFRFRKLLCHLVDETAIVESVFDGYATVGATPLAGTEWLPEDLEWDDEHPVTPFYGTDGELDEARARDAFREAGFQYESGTVER